MVVPALPPAPVIPLEFAATLSNGTGGSEELSLNGESSWDVAGGRETTKIFPPTTGLANDDVFWDADKEKKVNGKGRRRGAGDSQTSTL